MRKSSIYKIIIVSICVLFVPIFLYTVLQFSERDDNEWLIRSIYDRQLESILTLINEHSTEVISYWQMQMTRFTVSNTEAILQLNDVPEISSLVRQESTVSGAFLRTSEHNMIVALTDSATPTVADRTMLKKLVDETVADSSQTLNNLIRYAQEHNYIKPLSRHWSHRSTSYTILIFPILNPSFSQGVIFGGLLIDDLQFIREIVARRFSSMTDGEFIFAVQKISDQDMIYYSTENKPDNYFEQSKELWLMPQYELKIRMAGTTLERLSQRRVRLNLMFLAAIMTIFCGGAVYVFWNIRKEMEIARIKSNLVANVSHEIRTPVALIRMYAETLEMGRINNEDKKNKYYKIILAEAVRLSQLVNNMLDFSQIESNKKEYHLNPGDLGKVLSQVIEMYQHNFEQKNFQVNIKIAPNLPEISMDTEAAAQAIVNLIDNAMKYSTDKKIIDIILKQRNEHVLLSVTDHGIGIPPTEHKKIFQKFYRVGDSLVQNTKGSGLGLSLVEHIMNIHNGRVDVASTLGQGSTFTLIFPKQQGV